MNNWELSDDLKYRFNKIVSNIRRLQSTLGLYPMTLQQRQQVYRMNLVERQREKEELARIQKEMSKRRPLPKL